MRSEAGKLRIGDAANLLGGSVAAWYGPANLPKKGAAELHIVVACADRKSASAGDPVRLRTVRGRSLEERCTAWWRLLMRTPARMAARDLYVGDHWSVAKGLPALAEAKGFAPRLWVASAGYGLVPEEATLAPYSATFSRDSKDSVPTSGADPQVVAQEWWALLAAHSLRGHTGPRTLVGIAEGAARGAAMMVVASPAYMAAMGRDLAEVASRARDIRLVLLTTTPGPNDATLRDHWVPLTAPLRMSLGGALTSLHARVARRLLEKLSPEDLDVVTARRHIERLTARAPELPTFRRERSDDDDVRQFIRRELRHDVAAAHTRLLRAYRASGRACEQGRFRDLFMTERRER